MEEMIMMILSQDGMVAVNSDNVAMFEVKETETIPHEAQLMATIFISGGGRYTNAERICYPIGTFRSPDRTELAKLALDYISFSVSSGHKVSAQVPTEDEMRNIHQHRNRVLGAALCWLERTRGQPVRHCTPAACRPERSRRAAHRQLYHAERQDWHRPASAARPLV